MGPQRSQANWNINNKSRKKKKNSNKTDVDKKNKYVVSIMAEKHSPPREEGGYGALNHQAPSAELKI